MLYSENRLKVISVKILSLSFPWPRNSCTDSMFVLGTHTGCFLSLRIILYCLSANSQPNSVCDDASEAFPCKANVKKTYKIIDLGPCSKKSGVNITRLSLSYILLW
uniref:Uncharacterized protein n=1 Tax=Cacopsylla melanoneura TaxID=428564 RepID=A0A8D8S6N2_9HEMI